MTDKTHSEGYFDLVSGAITIPGPRMLSPVTEYTVKVALKREGADKPWQPADGAKCVEQVFKDEDAAVQSTARAAVAAYIRFNTHLTALKNEGFEDLITQVIAPVVNDDATPVVDPKPRDANPHPEARPDGVAAHPTEPANRPEPDTSEKSEPKVTTNKSNRKRAGS